MSIRDYLTALRRRWVVVVVAVVLCTVGALVLTAASDPVYRAQTTSFVTLGAGDGSGSLLQGSQFALQRVSSYTDVVDSPSVLEPVVAELGLDTTVADLRPRVDAVSPANTVLIDISATSDDPAEAAALADAVTRRFAAVIEQLETPREGGPSPVKVTVTVPATEPAGPVSPRPLLNLLLGLALGLGLGAGAALLRDQLDTSVRSADEIAELTSAGPLGMVSVDPDAARRPLVALDPGNSSAEAYRTVRTNLQFVDVDHPPRRIVVTSAVQGEGKSTTACNLAVTLAQGGRRVCLVDADLRRPRVADILGVEGAVGLSNVLAGQHAVGEVLMPWHDGLLTVLPAGTTPPNPSELLGSHHMSVLLATLSASFDVLVVDSPPVLPVSDAVILAQAADGALLVVRHGSTSRDQVAASVAALRTVGAGLIGTVMTFVPRRRGRAYRAYRYEAAPSGPRWLPSSLVGARRGATVAPAASHPGTAPSAAPAAAHAPVGRAEEPEPGWSDAHRSEPPAHQPHRRESYAHEAHRHQVDPHQPGGREPDRRADGQRTPEPVPDDAYYEPLEAPPVLGQPLERSRFASRRREG